MPYDMSFLASLVGALFQRSFDLQGVTPGISCFWDACESKAFAVYNFAQQA